MRLFQKYMDKSNRSEGSVLEMENNEISLFQTGAFKR